MNVRGFHPACLALPPPRESEVERMAESLRRAGLVDPVVVTPDGLVVDGRLRAMAAARVGVPLRFEVRDLSPLDAARLVAARHCAGRLFTSSQRAVVASRLATVAGLTKEAAAGLLGVSLSMVRTARRLDNADPSAADRVAAGAVALSAALSAARPAPALPAPAVPRRPLVLDAHASEAVLRALVRLDAEVADVQERSLALRTLARQAREALGE